MIFDQGDERREPGVLNRSEVGIKVSVPWAIDSIRLTLAWAEGQPDDAASCINGVDLERVCLTCFQLDNFDLIAGSFIPAAALPECILPRSGGLDPGQPNGRVLGHWVHERRCRMSW